MADGARRKSAGFYRDRTQQKRGARACPGTPSARCAFRLFNVFDRSRTLRRQPPFLEEPRPRLASALSTQGANSSEGRLRRASVAVATRRCRDSRRTCLGQAFSAVFLRRDSARSSAVAVGRAVCSVSRRRGLFFVGSGKCLACRVPLMRMVVVY